MSRFKDYYNGKEIFDNINTYVSLDIETTGFNPIENEIIEVGAIKVIDGIITDRFSTLIKPNNLILYSITKLTGIYNEDVIDAPKFEDIFLDLYNFTKGFIILGQNITFDLSFLYFNFAKNNIDYNNDYIDLLRLSRKCLPNLENHKLGTVADYLNVSYLGAHRAINDAVITHNCYIKLLGGFDNEI